MPTPADGPQIPPAWLFEVDPGEVDLVDAFVGGEAVLEFEVEEAHVESLRPGQVAHLWVREPAGIYATGGIVGPVRWIEDDDERYPVVQVGLDALADPIDGVALLAGDEFLGSPLHVDAVANPLPLDAAQSAAVAANSLAPGELSPVLGVAGDAAGDAAGDVDGVVDAGGDEDGLVLPALEVRLPADTLLVVDALDHDGWTVVRGTPDMAEVEELPERHGTFMDAVEYVASVADQAAGDLPVVPLDERVEAIAIFDAEGGVYLVVKEDTAAYSFCWLEDDGTLERVDAYVSLKEAILLPVLDQELFGGG